MEPDIETLLKRAEHSMREALRHVAAEIATYPTPISGCDAQFNHLLAVRTQIGAALDALKREVFIPTPRTPEPGAGIESR